MAILTIVQSLRLIRKTYEDSRVKDKNAKAQLKKPPTIISLHLINAAVALLIFSTVKSVSPKIKMLDPKEVRASE